MTNDTATPSLPPSSPARWRIPLLVAVAVLAIIVVTALVVGGEDDDPSTPAGPGETSSAPSATTEPSASASDVPSESVAPSSEPTVADPSADPVASPVIDAAVKDAIAAGFPALVPAGVPAGWDVVSAAFSKKGGGRWTIELTDPAGVPVRLSQSTAGLKDAVTSELGMAEQTGTVDLSDFGTGEWTVYGADGTVAIGTTIAKRFSAVIVSTGQDGPVTLAQQLLTAEDGDMPGAG